MKVADMLDEISDETGKPQARVAINWQTQKDFVSTAPVGHRTGKEALMNCAAFDRELDCDQIARIDRAVEENIDFDGADPAKPLKK